MRRRFGRRREEAGSAVVDTVLVIVALLPLVMGVLQLALVLHVRNTLASAAAEGARQAAVAGSSAARGEQRARDQIGSALAGRFAEHVVATPVEVGGAAGYRVEVVADVPVLGLGGPAVRIEVAGHAVAEEAR